MQVRKTDSGRTTSSLTVKALVATNIISFLVILWIVRSPLENNYTLSSRPLLEEISSSSSSLLPGGVPPSGENCPPSPASTTTATISSTATSTSSTATTSSTTNENKQQERLFSPGRKVGTQSTVVDYYDVPSGQQDFLDLATKLKTDKVAANRRLEACLKNHPKNCIRPGCAKEACRPWGHFYNTMYQKRLGPYSTPDTEPFQFLEIGFFNGAGFDVYNRFLPSAEAHSMEISCLPEGPREEGKWPWGNFAAKNKNYQKYLDARRLHCIDASNVTTLHHIWTTEMKRPDAPPLKMVVDDGSHLSAHMATSMFFWFPRIQPRGLLIMEDIQPIHEADAFRTQFLPQIMSDLHYCGDPKWTDEPCFPTLQPLLASIHCEMHICIFERNDAPAIELDLVQSSMPENALDLKKCKSLMRSY